jgi:hypothetical protein
LYKLETLLPLIVDWFKDRRGHLDVFAQADCRLEGWFKGELLVLFSKLVKDGVLSGFEREANVPVPGGRLQIDFRLRLGDQTHLCEVKALCISQAAGTPRNLKFYFRDDKLGLFKDFRKLNSIAATNKWLLAFVYPVPEQLAWESALGLRPSDLNQWVPFNAPLAGSPGLFVSLWQARDVVAGA